MFLIFALAQIADAPAADPPAIDPARIDVLDAIECGLAAPAYNAFVDGLFGDAALADKRHWRKLKSANFLISEYELPEPITLAGHYTTRRIALTSEGMMAELDLADPGVIAGAEHIANALDPKPFIDAIVASGRATRAEVESEVKFHPFRGEKVLVDRHDKPEAGEDFGLYTRIAHTISNDAAYPGITFYGCSYHIEPTDLNGKPL